MTEAIKCPKGHELENALEGDGFYRMFARECEMTWYCKKCMHPISGKKGRPYFEMDCIKDSFFQKEYKAALQFEGHPVTKLVAEASNKWIESNINKAHCKSCGNSPAYHDQYGCPGMFKKDKNFDNTPGSPSSSNESPITSDKNNVNDINVVETEDDWIDFNKQQPEIGQKIIIKNYVKTVSNKGKIIENEKSGQWSKLHEMALSWYLETKGKWKPAKQHEETGGDWIDFDKQKPEVGQNIQCKWLLKDGNSAGQFSGKYMGNHLLQTNSIEADFKFMKYFNQWKLAKLPDTNVAQPADKLPITDPKFDNQSEIGCQSECEHNFLRRLSGSDSVTYRCECGSYYLDDNRTNQSECEHDWVFGYKPIFIREDILNDRKGPDSYCTKCHMNQYKYNPINEPEDNDVDDINVANINSEELDKFKKNVAIQMHNLHKRIDEEHQMTISLINAIRCTCIDKVIEALTIIHGRYKDNMIFNLLVELKELKDK